MKKSIIGAGIGLLLIVSLLLPFQSTVHAQSFTVFATDSNSGYSDWTPSGNVSDVASPSIQPNSVRLRGTASILPAQYPRLVIQLFLLYGIWQSLRWKARTIVMLRLTPAVAGPPSAR